MAPGLLEPLRYHFRYADLIVICRLEENIYGDRLRVSCLWCRVGGLWWQSGSVKVGTRTVMDESFTWCWMSDSCTLGLLKVNTRLLVQGDYGFGSL